MTKIHLVRHGQTEWNLEGRMQGQTESQLTQLGIEQAKGIGKAVKDIEFDIVYSSSSVRAFDTATTMLNGRDFNINKMDVLKEIFLGEWEGKLYEEIEKNHPQPLFHFRNDPSQFNYPGLESFSELQERAASAFKSIVQKNPDKEILIVSHGAWIKVLLSHIDGRSLKNLWDHPKMANCAHSIVEETHPGEYKITLYAGQTEW